MTSPTGATIGHVLAVCAVERDIPLDPRKPAFRSAIDKRPVDGPVPVGPLGLDPDRVCDAAHHGGTEQAVYAYSQNEAQRWESELGRELPPGWFGENLRFDGPTTDLVVGARLRVGSTLELEVTIPRTPCRTFALWATEDDWIKRFTVRGDTGAYFRVHTPGTVAAGDIVTQVHVPEHGATVRDPFHATRPERIRALLTYPDLLPKVQRDAERALKRAQGHPGGSTEANRTLN